MGRYMRSVKTLITALLSVGLCGASFAADIPVKAPVAKAAPTWTGVMGIYAGLSTVRGRDVEDADNTIDRQWAFVAGGEARVNRWWTPIWSSQLGLEIEGSSNFDHTNDSRFFGTISSHHSLRDPNRGSIGIFSGYTYIRVLNDAGSATRSIYGAEAQIYNGPNTYYFQAGVSPLVNASNSGDFSGEEMKNPVFVRGVLRHFQTPNTKLQGEIGFMRATNNRGNGGETIDILNWGLLYEKRMPNSDLSYYLEYAGYKFRDWNGAYEHMTEHLFMVGVRKNFGYPTLIAADRHGASYDIPKFMRAHSWADAIR
jgi:hypothetical protein